MSLQQWVTSQANPEIPVNENFEVLGPLAVYGRDPTTTTGLTWGFNGGRWSGFAIADGSVTLAASNTNYLTVNRSNGALSASTSNSNWNDTGNFARVYLIVTGTSTVTSFEDHRVGGPGVYGFVPLVSTPLVPVNNQTGTTYTLALSDAAGVVRGNNSAAQTYTVPPGSSVAFAVGTTIAIRQVGAGAITLSPGAGVTLNIPTGFQARTARQGATIMIHEVAADSWDVTGDLATV